MKVNITSYQAVANWKWDLPEGSDDNCGICRNEFDATCTKCKFPGDECPIMIGECKHTFHMHCIAGWLASESSQGRCPMCRQTYREKVAEGKPLPRTPGVEGGQQGNGGASIVSR